MRKLQRELQKHDGPDHSVRDVRRPSWEDADKLEAEIMTPRDRLTGEKSTAPTVHAGTKHNFSAIAA